MVVEWEKVYRIESKWKWKNDYCIRRYGKYFKQCSSFRFGEWVILYKSACRQIYYIIFFFFCDAKRLYKAQQKYSIEYNQWIILASHLFSSLHHVLGSFNSTREKKCELNAFCCYWIFFFLLFQFAFQCLADKLTFSCPDEWVLE